MATNEADERKTQKMIWLFSALYLMAGVAFILSRLGTDPVAKNLTWAGWCLRFVIGCLGWPFWLFIEKVFPI